jgi:DNA-directed RNA polymerase subunit RPC12/RpoP
MSEPNRTDYRCARCGGTFVAEWSTEEAEAEAQQNWGVEHASQRADMDVICDDCYQQFQVWLKHTERKT